MPVFNKIRNLTNSPFSGFAAIIFFITLSDAIMSYMAPVFVEKHFNNVFIVGLVISTSSLFGMFFDFFIAQRLFKKTVNFFVRTTILCAFLFPLILLIAPAKVFFIIIAMIVWSIYYEFRGVSEFNFIHRHSAIQEHVNSWSVISTVRWVAYMVGPAFAVYLMNQFFNLPFFSCLFLVLAAFLFYLISKKNFLKPAPQNLAIKEAKSFKSEVKILRILASKVWPLILFQVSCSLYDVLFWTVGVLYAEKLREQSSLGGLFMTIYGVPALYAAFLARLPHSPLGKKRAAFLFATVAGVATIIIGFSSNILLTLLFVLLSSTALSITAVLNSAVFEDYVARLKSFGNDMTSLTLFSSNLAYFVGPITLGYISQNYGYENTFKAAGVFISVIALISLLVVPRKIRMPQTELITQLT